MAGDWRQDRHLEGDDVMEPNMAARKSKLFEQIAQRLESADVSIALSTLYWAESIVMSASEVSKPEPYSKHDTTQSASFGPTAAPTMYQGHWCGQNQLHVMAL
jgi:hypothetical protein